MQLPVVYAAVGIIADGLAQLPIEVRQVSGGSDELVTQHPASDLFERQPNPYMTPFTFDDVTATHTLLWGNGYAEIQRTRNGELAGLWPLLPDRTAPKKTPDGDVYYQTTVDGESVPLAMSDVLHFPAIGFDGLVGYSPIWMCRQAVGMALAMEKFGGKFFSNDMKSGGFILHPGKLGDKAVQNLTDSLASRGGLDNAHRVKVLEEGAKFVQTTIPPEDAQFLGSREFQTAEIARIYRIPLHMLQSVSGSTSWGSGIEEMTMGFLKYTLSPWIIRREQEMNRKLFTQRERLQGLRVRYDVSGLLRGDTSARSEFYTRALDPSTGWMLRNEVRQKEGMNPLSDDEWQTENRTGV